jgi:hypothetical protein
LGFLELPLLHYLKLTDFAAAGVSLGLQGVESPGGGILQFPLNNPQAAFPDFVCRPF